MYLDTIMGDIDTARKLSEENNCSLLDLNNSMIGSQDYISVLEEQAKDGIVISFDKWKEANTWHRLQLMHEDIASFMLKYETLPSGVFVVSPRSTEANSFAWRVKTDFLMKKSQMSEYSASFGWVVNE